MKKIILILLALLMFSACSSESSSLSLYTESEDTAIIEAENADTDMDSSITLDILSGQALQINPSLDSGIIRLSFYEGEDTQGDPVILTDVFGSDPIVINFSEGSYTMVVNIMEKATGKVEIVYVDVNDTQNPTMNFVGTYAQGRCTIEVSAGEGNIANFYITWGNNYAEISEWTMSGDFDSATKSVDYVDAVRKNITFGDDGEVSVEEVLYTDGTGTFIFNDNGSLTWLDNNEYIAQDVVFDYVSINQ